MNFEVPGHRFLPLQPLQLIVIKRMADACEPCVGAQQQLPLIDSATSSMPFSRLERLYHLYSDVPWQLLPLSDLCCPISDDALMVLSCAGPSHILRCVLQYSLWLDDHSTPEVLRGVRAALDACAPAAKGQPGFDDVYPLMLRLSSAQ